MRRSTWIRISSRARRPTHREARRGILRGVKVTAIVSAAKRIKAAGDEPTYGAVVAACPRATLNPSTNEPVDKSLVYAVFREYCYDDDPADTLGSHEAPVAVGIAWCSV